MAGYTMDGIPMQGAFYAPEMCRHHYALKSINRIIFVSVWRREYIQDYYV